MNLQWSKNKNEAADTVKSGQREESSNEYFGDNLASTLYLNEYVSF